MLFAAYRNVVVPGLLLLMTAAGQAGEMGWERVQLDARFRSEGVAVGDFNKDGKQDIVAGDYWYEAPNWTRHEVRKPGEYWAGDGYSHSFCNWSYDINQDGWQDVIIVGFPGEPFHWYENPKGEKRHWKEHLIWHSICNETPIMKDLNGDGRPEIIFGSQPEAQMGYVSIPEGDAVYQKWTFIPVSEPGDPMKNGTFKYYHGLGATDANGDGRLDIAIMHGYWEQPAELEMGLWKWVPGRLGDEGSQDVQRGADIYSQDLDLDGDQDFLASCAHAYGVWWYENKGNGEFVQHTIDKSFSQTHALWLVDLDGDGQRELVTGKRYFAHNGADPGGLDPSVMYWYRVKPGKGGPTFEAHEIQAGRDTGVGTQFEVADIDGDGLLDIALSNKKGVNLLFQRR